MTDHVQCETLGEVLSPSQVHTYLTCPAKWCFRYLLGLSEPATGSLALGRAFHQTLATNFRQKMSSRRDLAVAEIREVFAEAWASNCADAEFRDDEDPSELAATGEVPVIAYMTNAARSIEPQAVELPVDGEIAGVQVRGIVDVVDVNGRVIDFKTASKRPQGVPPEYGLQLTTYAMITPGANGSCRLDTVTKAKTVEVVQQTYNVGTEERHFAETL